MFIPGSYHSVVAVLAYYRSMGFTYEDVAAFESEEWWNSKDD